MAAVGKGIQSEISISRPPLISMGQTASQYNWGTGIRGLMRGMATPLPKVTRSY